MRIWIYYTSNALFFSWKKVKKLSCSSFSSGTAANMPSENMIIFCQWVASFPHVLGFFFFQLVLSQLPSIYFVIPPNSNTFSDWRRTCHVSLVKTSFTCHWSKLHDVLSTHTWSGRAPLKRRQICTPADVKQIIFICVLFYFELEGITKHLTTGPSGNREFCFPSTSGSRGNKTHCFPWGQSLSA